MKALLLIGSLLLLGLLASAQTHVILPHRGEVLITGSPGGLQSQLVLYGAPGEKLLLKFLSNCQPVTPPWRQHRNTFEISLDMGKGRLLQRTLNFPGIHERDLIARNLNSIALYKNENAYWRLIACERF
ncbi:hypothetical protein [Bdellovibrio sp. HCB288]|uniref:hypothetical protein n=1 Tax=Bdellovibrio sp. HCB288 TaxID=3394355 RepID=UPI0039B64564